MIGTARTGWAATPRTIYWNSAASVRWPKITAELSADELDRLLDPAHYLGQAQVWVERAVAEHTQLSA